MGAEDTHGLSVPVRRRTIHPPAQVFGQDRTGCGMPPGGARPPGQRHAAFPAERKAGAAVTRPGSRRSGSGRNRHRPPGINPLWPNERSRRSSAPVPSTGSGWAGGEV